MLFRSIRVEYLQACELHFAEYLHGPGFYSWWQEHKVEFVDEEFRQVMDQIIQKTHQEYAQ